jgi:hypothetical protein
MELVNFSGKEISTIYNRGVTAVISLRVSCLFLPTSFQLNLGCAYKILERCYKKIIFIVAKVYLFTMGLYIPESLQAMA